MPSEPSVEWFEGVMKELWTRGTLSRAVCSAACEEYPRIKAARESADPEPQEPTEGDAVTVASGSFEASLLK